MHRKQPRHGGKVVHLAAPAAFGAEADPTSREPSASKILRMKEVQVRTGLSRITIWRRLRKGDFPQPVQLSENAIGWLEAEIEQWLRSRPRLSYSHAPAPEAA